MKKYIVSIVSSVILAVINMKVWGPLGICVDAAYGIQGFLMIGCWISGLLMTGECLFAKAEFIMKRIGRAMLSAVLTLAALTVIIGVGQ